MRKFLLPIALLCLIVVEAQAVATNIIPRPQTMTLREGSFTLSPTAHIAYAEGLHDSAEYLAEYLSISIEPYRALREGDVVMMLNDNLAHEEYTLDVSRNCIIMQGGSAAAIHNAIESLLQLLPAFIGDNFSVPMDVFSVWCEEETIFYTDAGLSVGALLRNEEVSYQAVLQK